MRSKGFDPREARKINDEDRMWYVELWAEYVKTHPDQEWSAEQKKVIDAQVQSGEHVKLTPKEYLEIKGEICKR